MYLCIGGSKIGHLVLGGLKGSPRGNNVSGPPFAENNNTIIYIYIHLYMCEQIYPYPCMCVCVVFVCVLDCFLR